MKDNIMKLADACEIAATNKHQWGLETDGEDRIVTRVLYRSAEAAYVTARAKLEAAVNQQAAEIERLKQQKETMRLEYKALELQLTEDENIERDRDFYKEKADALQAKLSAMEKQEPVAYVMEFNDGTTTIQKTAYWDCKSVTPLYPAPKVAQPLTDEQIDEIQQTWIGKGMKGSRSFARAIEKAHGIGGQQP